MAEAEKSREKPVILSPKALEKALAACARRAHRLAQAFGQKVSGQRLGTPSVAAMLDRAKPRITNGTN